MSNLAYTTKKLILGGTVTFLVMFGVSQGPSMITNQFEIGQQAWGDEKTGTAQDLNALEALYHATGGDQWKRNDGWLSNAPLEDWYGLRVSNGRVIFLELDDNNLTGEIPVEIGMLDHLYVLDLRWNSISGGLENLNALTDLGELLLTANNFSGSMTKVLGGLMSLRRLDVSSNEFAGTIPKELGDLLHLETFAAHSNELTGEIPKELCDLPHLKRVVLSDNELSGSISDRLKNCESLQHLNLANNLFKGPIPEQLISSKRLNWLDLRGNKFVDEKQPLLRISFPGIYVPTDQMDEIGGLAMWSRGSSLYATEEFRLKVVRALSAMSAVEGVVELIEARVPSDLVDQAKDSVQFINSYLQESGTRIDSLSDFERMIAKAEKRSLTKTLKHLDSMHGVLQYDSGRKGVDIQENGNFSQRYRWDSAVFNIDTESSGAHFKKSYLHRVEEPVDFLKVSGGNQNETEFVLRKDNIRFTVSVSTTGVYLDGETNLKADGEYDYRSGLTKGTEMKLYYSMHKVVRGGGFTTVGTEVAHVKFLNHPANQDKSLQVNWNLNESAHYFAALTATPTSSNAFQPPFVMVQSQPIWFRR